MVDAGVVFVVSAAALAALVWQYRRLSDVESELAYDYHKSLRRVQNVSVAVDAIRKELDSLRQAAAKKAGVRETEGLLAEAIAELVGGGKEKVALKVKARA